MRTGDEDDDLIAVWTERFERPTRGWDFSDLDAEMHSDEPPWSYESPLDPLVVALGQLEITPAGAKAPLELNKITVRRAWPPTRDQLITVGPGGSVMSSILLKEDAVPPGALQGKVSMELKGRWQAVWSIRKENIPDQSLEDPFSSPEVERGKYSTGKVLFHF